MESDRGAKEPAVYVTESRATEEQEIWMTAVEMKVLRPGDCWHAGRRSLAEEQS